MLFQDTRARVIQMDSVPFKEFVAVPDEVEVVYEAQLLGAALRVKPIVEAENFIISDVRAAGNGSQWTGDECADAGRLDQREEIHKVSLYVLKKL